LARSRAPRAFVAKPPAIIAVGSRDPITEQQVAWLAANAKAQIVRAPGGELPQEAMHGPLTIFVCTGEMVASAASVARRFGRAIAVEARRIQPSTLLLTGGDTALEVLKALGTRVVQVGGEAAAGLPWLEVEIGGKPTVVVTKSGGFGSEDILSRVLGNLNPRLALFADDVAVF
jgi:D-threonate/D-erythronate kinase